MCFLLVSVSQQQHILEEHVMTTIARATMVQALKVELESQLLHVLVM